MFLTKKKGTNPRISMDWLNIKRLHCRHSKMVKWLNQTEHTLWGSSRRDLQKDRMRLHELSPLSKGQSICVFQKKLNQNQNHKIGKECHEHCTTFHYIALFHMRSALPNFTTKVACICIPKNHVNCIDFLHLMSKSCGFGMTGPLDESISCFLIRVDLGY